MATTIESGIFCTIWKLICARWVSVPRKTRFCCLPARSLYALQICAPWSKTRELGKMLLIAEKLWLDLLDDISIGLKIWLISNSKFAFNFRNFTKCGPENDSWCSLQDWMYKIPPKNGWKILFWGWLWWWWWWYIYYDAVCVCLLRKIITSAWESPVTTQVGFSWF